MNIFEHFGADLFPFGLEIGYLATHHAVHGPGSGSDFAYHRDAAFGGNWRASESFESQRKQRVAGQDRGCLAEALMAGRLPASQVVIVERRQIVVDERVGVNELNGAAGVERGRHIRLENARCLQAENRADAFPAREDGVAHGLMNRMRRHGFGGHQAVKLRIDRETVFFKELRETHRLFVLRVIAAEKGPHDWPSPPGSKGSGVIFPSAFFSRISTRPSASSSCFWHSRESPTPSSKSFIASSRESCGLSSLRTTSSSLASERSKSGFFTGSGFFDAG